MKKLTLTSIVVLSAFLSQAQWQPDVRLTNNTAYSRISDNYTRCVASNGLVVHVVWFDMRDGEYEIYYKRSTDGGVSWGTDTRLTNTASPSQHPSVAVSGADVYVVWQDYRDGNWEIYYKHSTDDGLNWSSDLRLTTNTLNSSTPSVTVHGSEVHVVWRDLRDGKQEMYYKHSTKSGTTWSGDTRLANNISVSGIPSISVSGSFVLVVWIDERDGNTEIYCKYSTDAGGSWGSDTRLTNNVNAYSPSVSVTGSFVNVVWVDYRDGNLEIYYKKSIDGGISWGTETRLTDNTSVKQLPSVAASGPDVYVVWNDSRDGNSEIYCKLSTNAGVSWEADTRLTNYTGDSYAPSIAISDSVVHIVWNDSRDGNSEIYYKRNPKGTYTGINGAGTQMLSGHSLTQNYPNPFATSTAITWQLPEKTHVVLKVYDFTGREVKTLVDENHAKGEHKLKFDAIGLPAGVYFYKLQANGKVETKKMIVSR